MTLSRTLLLSLALFAGSSIGCHHNKGGRNGVPSATGGPMAQNDDMNRTSGADVGNGTDTSGNGSTTPDPQQTQMPRCPEPVPGETPDPRCEDRSPAPPTTPDPHP